MSQVLHSLLSMPAHRFHPCRHMRLGGSHLADARLTCPAPSRWRQSLTGPTDIHKGYQSKFVHQYWTKVAGWDHARHTGCISPVCRGRGSQGALFSEDFTFQRDQICPRIRFWITPDLQICRPALLQKRLDASPQGVKSRARSPHCMHHQQLFSQTHRPGPCCLAGNLTRTFPRQATKRL